jgi:alkylhydroperoxidase/carboxymuconolactone decarboxylase family protein YurZ
VTIKAGASREEVSDVLAMSIQMGGGPAMMYAAKALTCYDELTAA